MITIEHTYRYLAPSRLDLLGSGSAGLRLATSGEHPHFFEGFVEHPETVAVGLLVVARVASTRFFTPPNMIAAIKRAADPVVTSDGACLRFESLSACCGVYARLDLLPSGLEYPPTTSGTTNVDVNPPLRQALSRLGGRDPLHLRIGADQLTVTTLDAELVERKVDLPVRWLRSFAEVTLSAAAMTRQLDLPKVAARRFVQGLARTSESRQALWLTAGTPAPRLATRPSPGAVCLAGPARLRVIEPVLRFAERLSAFGRPGPFTADFSARRAGASSGWVVDLPGARLTVMLSPDPSRGFSGEGQVLLADAELGASVGVGYDLDAAARFRRELPYDQAALVRTTARLSAARRLIAEGAVRLDAERAYVTSGDVVHVVRTVGALGDEQPRCTCPWFAQYASSRGPCKHVLAAELLRRPRSPNDGSGEDRPDGGVGGDQQSPDLRG